MSKSVESTRRELFEQLVSIPDSVTWSNETKSYIGQNFWLVDYAWEAFNAALDAVEIELPLQTREYDRADEYYNMAIDCCKDSIERTNLGLKIK
jgi:hypothetical protein